MQIGGSVSYVAQFIDDPKLAKNQIRDVSCFFPQLKILI